MSDVTHRATCWIVDGDSGLSSEAIWANMMGAERPRWGWSHPLDPADLGRCLRLLELIPEWKPRLPEMARRSKPWAALIANWPTLEASMRDEAGIDWSKNRSAPKTYDLMQRILKEARAAA